MIEHSVASLAELVGGVVVGDGSRIISGVGDLRTAGPAQIGFVRDVSYHDAVRESHAGALVVGEEFETQASQILVEDVPSAFAKVALVFHPPPQATAHRVHPTAVVDPAATLREPVDIGAKAVVERAEIGAGTVLMPGVFVGAGCKIGDDCVLHPGVVLYAGVQLGDRVIVHGGTVIGSDGFGYAKDGARYVKLPQLGTVVVDDDVEIGANCTIDRGTLGPTRIGRGSKLDNLVHLAHNCVLGEDNALAGVCALSGSTVLGDRVTLAGHVISAGHLKLVDDVRVGGNSVLYGDIDEPGDYVGFPLMEKRRFARHLRALRNLVELYRGRRGEGAGEAAGEAAGGVGPQGESSRRR